MATEKPQKEAPKTRRRATKAQTEPVAEPKVETTMSAEKATTAATEADFPDVAPNERIQRYDVVITSERPGYKPPKTAFAAMVQQLAFRGFGNPVDEAIAETWTDVYFEPGPAAHEIFIEKEYSSEEPVFDEIILRVQDKPFYCDFSQTPGRPLYWSIEIRGSRFTSPLGAFRKLFFDAFNLRIAVDTCDARPKEAHRVVPKEELPPEKKKRERSSGLAGIEVEEL